MANEFIVRNGLIAQNNTTITGSLNVTGGITGSNALFTGTITAQKLVVQTVTSSVLYSSGSNIFGNDLSNTQTFTGSVSITGSIRSTGNIITSGSLNILSAGSTASDLALRIRNSTDTNNLFTVTGNGGFSSFKGGTVDTYINSNTTINGSGRFLVLNVTASSSPWGIVLRGGTGETGRLVSDDGSGNLILQNSWSNYGMAFNTSGSNTRMFITGTGNVGIGMTNPGALLHVGNISSTSSELIRIGVTYDSARTSRGGIAWYDSSNATGKIYTEFDGAMVSMVFGSLYNSGYNSNTSMIIRGNGNVGIGTTTPNAKLDVNGNTIITGSLNVTSNITGSNALFTGTITAQKLVVQQVTSSVLYSSGSNIFGNDLSNTQTFTGSVSITGSNFLFNNNRVIDSSLTSSMSVLSSSYALTASYAMNGGSGGGAAFPFSGSAIISGSLEVKNPTPIPTGSIFVPTNNLTTLYASSSISQSASYNILTGSISYDGQPEPDGDNTYTLDTTVYIIAYSNQYHSATSPGIRFTDSSLYYYEIIFSPASVQSPATITGYDIYFFNHLNSTWYRNTQYASYSGSTFSIPYIFGQFDSPTFVTSSLLSLSNDPVPVYTTFNTVGINKSSSLNGVLDINGNTIVTGSFTVTTGSNIEFQVTNTGVKIGNILTDAHTITGSLNITGSVITTGSIVGNVSTLTISSNTASLNLNNGNFFTLQLVSGSNTFINPSNIKTGQTINLLVSTTGSATVSFPSTVKQVSGSSYVPTTTTGTDIITLISFNTASLYLANVKNLA